jgi:hypothetical protein
MVKGRGKAKTAGVSKIPFQASIEISDNWDKTIEQPCRPVLLDKTSFHDGTANTPTPPHAISMYRIAVPAVPYPYRGCGSDSTCGEKDSSTLSRC